MWGFRAVPCYALVQKKTVAFRGCETYRQPLPAYAHHAPGACHHQQIDQRSARGELRRLLSTNTSVVPGRKHAQIVKSKLLLPSYDLQVR